MSVIYPGLKRLESWGVRVVGGCLTAASLFAVSHRVGAQPATPPSPAAPASPPAAPATSPSAPTVPPASTGAPPAAPKPAGVLTTGALGASLEERVKRLQPSGAEPCAVRGSLEHGERTYVACGPAGVWIIEVDTTRGDHLVGIQPFEGSVVGVFVRGERVWAELSISSARPVSLTSGAQMMREAGSEPSRDAVPVTREPRERAVPPPSSPSEVDMVVTGRVLSSDGGRVVVDLGREHDVSVGSHVEFVVTTPDDSPLGKFWRRHVVAVGRVSSVTETQSLVELGVAEEVPLGAEASVSSRSLTRNRSAPPRAAGLWTVSGIIRPFFVLEELGIGALNELSVGYQSHGALRYQLQLAPIAFASAGPGSTVAALAVGLISYDTRLFEIGLGFGFQTVNDGDYEPGTGLTVAQSLRFGALDGLNLSIRNDISLFHSEFDYSAFSGEAQIPVSDRGWMVLEGGGGTVGHAFIEVGGKVLLQGNGTRGSLFLRGTIGYAALYENQLVTDSSGFTSTDELFYGGPLIGLGLEWRN